MRIATLLCALAGLAELAAPRSAAVRGFVLWLLRHAEAVARDFALSDEDLSHEMPAGPAGGGPDDAMRLAASLRELARTLERQAALLSAICCEGGSPRRRPSWDETRMTALCSLSSAMLAAFAEVTPPLAPDTS